MPPPIPATLDRRARLEPGVVAGQGLPHRGRSRRRRRRPAGRAGPRRWPCRGRQFKGAGGRRYHRRDHGPERRADRERAVRRHADRPADRAGDACEPSRRPTATRALARQGAESDARRSASPRSPTWARRREDWAAIGAPAKRDSSRSGSSAMRPGLPNWEIIHDGVPTGWLYGDRLALVGVKLYADGALGSRGALLKRPMPTSPTRAACSSAPMPSCSSRRTRRATAAVSSRCTRSATPPMPQVIGVFEKIGAKYRPRSPPADRAFPDRRPEATSRASQPAGIIASMQPVHQTSDRLMAEARLGPSRLGGAYAWRTVAKLGIPLAFGSDFPVESPNPFPGLAAAISRQDMSGAAAGRLAAGGEVTLRAGARRLHARRGLCRLRRGQVRLRSSPATGPTSSSSTATRPRSTRRRWRGRRCSRPGSPARTCSARGRAEAGEPAR